MNRHSGFTIFVNVWFSGLQMLGVGVLLLFVIDMLIFL